jgi:predicted ABC-type transport system involved in lysophospholipase L1 biosynthesis ATPase subunit
MNAVADAILQIDDVTKIYPSHPPVTALREMSFTVAPGELVGIVGPSGSGKTTLLHVLGTLDRPTSGQVRVTGLDIGRMTDRELATLRATRIGFVFQQFFLAEHETVLDNVADGLLYTGISQRRRRERAVEALTAVGLGDRLHARPTQLSGGQRQRVAIARAPGRLTGDRAGGRTHRQPRFRHRAGDHHPARRPQSGRCHHPGDNPQPDHRRPTAAADRGAGRAHHRRHRPPRRRRGPGVTDPLAARRLRIWDLARLASIGLRTRKLRAGLSALGIALGVAAIVAVLGLSASSQAGLLAEIDRLGTNLLTVTNGQTLSGETAELPTTAPGMISRIGPVTAVQYTGTVNGVEAFRSPLIPSIHTNALSVQAASLDLPAHGRHQPRRRSLPQLGHGTRTGCGARLDRGGAAGHRPALVR